MLELMGSGYVIDYCVSAFLKKQQTVLYESYIADCLRTISESSASHNGGPYIKERYSDLRDRIFGSNSKNNNDDDGRTSSEVINDMVTKINMLGEHKEEVSTDGAIQPIGEPVH